VFKASNQKILDKKELLEYLKNKQSPSNGTILNTTSQNPISTPQSCLNHIDNIVNFSIGQSIQASYTQNNILDSSIIGQIAQIIDPDGNIRYVQITNINSSSGLVTVNTGSGEKEYTLDEFTTAFTGILLKTNTTPDTILNTILTKEKNDLNQENNKAQTIHNKAKNKIILWAVLMSVALILLVIGAIMAVYFGYSIVQSITNPKITYDLESVYWDEHGYRNYIGETGLTSYQLRALMAELTRLGFKLEAGSITETSVNIFAQNWVQVVLCIVGLILALLGIGLLIAGIIQTVRNSLKIRMTNIVLRRNQEDSKNFEGWLAVNNTNILQNSCLVSWYSSG